MKALLIDDSYIIRMIQKNCLANMGITDIVEAANGKEALNKLIEFNYEFQFIICDINMPVMNGIETLRAIRANPRSAKLPVIMCTSISNESQISEAFKEGATNYLAKPFRSNDLKSKVESVIQSIITQD